VELPEQPALEMENGETYEPPKLSHRANAAVFSSVTGLSLVADAALGGGFWGAVAAFTAGVAGLYLAPAAKPYFDDVKTAVSSAMEHERAVRRARKYGGQQANSVEEVALLAEDEQAGGAVEEFEDIAEAAISSATVPTAIPVRVELGPDQMDFGNTLRPHGNKVFSGRKALFGVSDAGKSNNVAVIAEEIAQTGAALFVLDTEGEYGSICQKPFFFNPFYADRSNLPPEQAYQFAQWAVAGLHQVVINLQTYEDEEAAWMMIGLIQGLKDWEEAQEMKVPCEIILDEATVWLPQMGTGSPLSQIMVVDPAGVEDEAIDEEDEEENSPEGGPKGKKISLLALLKRAFFSIVVRRGRKRGIGFTLAAQRIAELDKQALSASWVILMRQTQAADFKEYRKFGITAEQALSLKPGEAFVRAPGCSLERHQFRLRCSPHGAKSPGFEELRSYQRRLMSNTEQPPQPVSDETSRQTLDPGDTHSPDGRRVKKTQIKRRMYYHSLRQADGSLPSTSRRLSPSGHGSRQVVVEGAREGGRRDDEGMVPKTKGTKGKEGHLSELEMRIGELFFSGTNVNAIIAMLWPDVKGGTVYQEKSGQVADAIRRYHTSLAQQSPEKD
jgi:hypothetical protein